MEALRLSSAISIRSTIKHSPRSPRFSHALSAPTSFLRNQLRSSSAMEVSGSSSKRGFSVVSGLKSENGYSQSAPQISESFFRSVLACMEDVYLNRNPTAKTILELVQSAGEPRICYDHLAFRTFGEIIRRYTQGFGGGEYAALASSVGSLTWGTPSSSEFQKLAGESEYAAWTLVNGYALNHVTISTHRLKSQLKDIKNLNEFVKEKGFSLNSEGGVLKVSPDGLLLQSSTVADSRQFQFSDSTTKQVPCSYIEFAERLVLPQFKNLPIEEVKEQHRRDGFEVGNADKIFESTSSEQLTKRTA